MGELYWQVELDYTLRLPKVPKPTFDVNDFLKALKTIFNYCRLTNILQVLFSVEATNILKLVGQIFYVQQI